MDSDICIKSFHNECDNFSGDNPNQIILDQASANYEQTIKTRAIFELDGLYYRILQDFNSLVDNVKCELKFSTTPSLAGTTNFINIDVAHRAINIILNSIQSLP